MIVAVEGSATSRFEAVRRLAERLFPPEVLEPEDEWKAEADGASRIPYRYLAWEENGVEGFLRFARLVMGIGFVVHIGVAPERQGAGIGRRLLQASRDALKVPVLVAEVEDGESMAWWRRQGAEVVSAHYTQPALRAETPDVCLSLVAMGPWREIPDLVTRFYAEVWQRDEQDPLVRRAVEA